MCLLVPKSEASYHLLVRTWLCLLGTALPEIDAAAARLRAEIEVEV